MRRSLTLFACCFLLAASVRGAEPIFPDGTPASLQGGLMILRQGNQTTVSLGGVLFSRRVKVTTLTPEGPVVTRFILPSFLHSPTTPPLPDAAPAILRVEIPETYGVLYLEGELVRSKGTSRQLQSPPLPPGRDYPLHVRAAYQVGDHILIEDKQVLLRAGQFTAVTFDGRGALSVPLPRGD